MNSADLATLSELIAAQLAETQTTIDGLEASLGSLKPDDAIGRLTRMEAIEAQSVAQTQLEHQRQHYQQLLGAQKRLENDPDFGYCQECGELIPMPRLRIRPEAKLCVECAD